MKAGMPLLIKPIPFDLYIMAKLQNLDEVLLLDSAIQKAWT